MENKIIHIDTKTIAADGTLLDLKDYKAISFAEFEARISLKPFDMKLLKDAGYYKNDTPDIHNAVLLSDADLSDKLSNLKEFYINQDYYQVRHASLTLSKANIMSMKKDMVYKELETIASAMDRIEKRKEELLILREYYSKVSDLMSQTDERKAFILTRREVSYPKKHIEYKLYDGSINVTLNTLYHGTYIETYAGKDRKEALDKLSKLVNEHKGSYGFVRDNYDSTYGVNTAMAKYHS